MATLNLEEQEQLDQLKAFWAKWGTLISGLVTAGLLAFAGWNLWQEWQRREGAAAAHAFDAFERGLKSNDLAKATPLFEQLRKDYPRSSVTTQAALLLAQQQGVQGKGEDAIQTLNWASTQGVANELRELAQWRLSGALLQAGQYPQAEAALALVTQPAYAALVADRRGDLAQLQNQADKAREHYRSAYAALKDEDNYRRFVEAKLMALGVDPATVVKIEGAK